MAISVEQREEIWEGIRLLDDPVSKEALEVLLDELTDHVVKTVLSAEQVLRLGALSVEQDQTLAIKHLLAEQEKVYRETLTLEGPEPLIRALLDRDTQLVHLGRQIADGSTAGKLLREFMRAALIQSDHRALKRIDSSTAAGAVEGVLKVLGAAPADARQLQLHGSTLGSMENPDAAADRINKKWQQDQDRDR